MNCYTSHIIRVQSIYLQVHVQQHTGTTTHWYDNTLVQQHTGTTTHWYNNTLVQQHTGTTTHWYNNTLVQQHTGTTTLWYNNTLVQQHTGTTTLWSVIHDHALLEVHHNVLVVTFTIDHAQSEKTQISTEY